MWFLFTLLIGLAISVVAYLLMPRPKKPAPPAVQDMDNPTADAGRPIPVVFGSVTVKGLNILWYGDKQYSQYEINI